MRHREQWEQWQLDEQGPAAYERYLVPAMMRRWADELTEWVAPGPGERVLDVGCGTGIVARTAAHRVGAGGTVIGVDVNEAMLQMAGRVGARRDPAIEWKQADATDMPFPDGAFDVVVSQQALQFMPDPLAALREMRRVLASNGRLGVLLCRPIAHSPAYIVMAEALGRHVGADAESMMRSPFSSWATDELRSLVSTSGFREVRVRLGIAAVRYASVAELVRREAASSPLAGPIGGMSLRAREALLHDAQDALRDHVDDEGVLLPIGTHLLQARP